MSQYRGVSPQQAILEILSKGRSYGMGIRAVALERMGVDFSAGTLYPALRALERDGFISSNEDPSHVGGGKKKVYYELTPEGLRAAASVRRQVLSLYGHRPLPESVSEEKPSSCLMEWVFGIPESLREYGYRMQRIELSSEKDLWADRILSVKIGGSPELLDTIVGGYIYLRVSPILIHPNTLIVRGEVTRKEDKPSLVLHSTLLCFHRESEHMQVPMAFRSATVVTPD